MLAPRPVSYPTVTDDEQPADIIATFRDALPPGSYLVLSHGTGDFRAEAVYDGASAPGVPRSRDDIERFLDGLELVPPGVTDAAAWRPGPVPVGPPGRPALFYAGIGRVPRPPR